MINGNSELINSPVRHISAKAEVYDSTSALISTYNDSDIISSINIQRVGEGKFFGFGICQRLNIKLIDINRDISFTTDNKFKILFNDVCNYPLFKVSEVNRDENTNELSITAYDIIYKANTHTMDEIAITSYTIKELATDISTVIGANGILIENLEETEICFDTSYPDGANFEGTENLRDVLNAIAEVTQTIYYINGDNKLVFKRLNKNSESILTIEKKDYFELDCKTNRRLSTIIHCTELGDNVSVETTEKGTTQFVRDNPFWELRDDIDTLLNNAITVVGGLTINQFNLDFRGNYLLEIGDKINIVTKDNDTVISYVLDDTIDYNGTFSEKLQWSYEDNETETTDNPSDLGDALKQTFARVDKANKKIDLYVSQIEENKENISALQLDTESISASVKQVEKNTENSLNSVNEDISTLTNQVSAKMSAEDVQLQISTALQNGVECVETSTGFTFNESGLLIEKSNSEISTQITEDGMRVMRDGENVLIADNQGVQATNLHATTYLIIGTNSRFEDYDSNRTGCFWIGE